MNITNIKINGLVNPIGFAFPVVICSWKVMDCPDKIQTNVKIEVAKEPEFQEVIVKLEEAGLLSSGQKIPLETEKCKRYYVRVTVTGNKGSSAVSDIAYFETGKQDEKWKADYISTSPSDTFHPEFVKEFSLSKQVKSARIYISGLGVYEAYLNNLKIGEDLLAPFYNDYNYGIQYQTYDIGMLLNERNEIRIITGNGWYKGRFGYDGAEEVWGDRFVVIAELQILFSDGSTEVIPTDLSWKYRGSLIESSDIYDGECYNRLLWKGQENPLKPVQILDMDKSRLKERYSMPLVVKEHIPVKKVLVTPAGETVLDMGQNFSGYLQINVNLKKGSRIILDYGEILQDKNFYNENYRTAKAQFTYVSDGAEDIVRPHFTYYGFRYVRVTGWNDDIKPEYFTGCVMYSDMDVTLTVETSDENINRLAENAMWSQKSNFLDMPTDCPQRDERLGWTGDAQVFAPTASYHMDTRAFYRKFLYDLRLDQKVHNGAVASYIPNVFQAPLGSSVWGDAATLIPLTMYQYYGEKELLFNCYPMMKDWVDYIIRGEEERGRRNLWEFNFHFGDWLAQDGITSQSAKGGTDDYFIASVYYFVSCQNVAKSAGILGLSKDMHYYGEKAEKIYEAILNEYFSPAGRLTIDTQTAYLISLPIAARMIDGHDAENMNMTLEELQEMAFMGFTHQMVQEAAARLMEIRVDLK